MNSSPLKTTCKLAVLISLFFSLYLPNTHAQNSQTKFDSVYIHIATSVASQDIGKAIAQTDSLSRHSENNFQKTKSYLLLALLYEAKGDITDALFFATQAEEIAIKENNYEYQVRSAGYLSTLYRRVDLIKESNRHILIAEKANAKRKSEPNYDAIQSVIHHEKSMHEIDNGNYKKALQELVKSEACLTKMPDSPAKNASLAAIYESFAEYYILVKEFDKAKSKAQKGLELIGESDQQIVGLLHNYLGLIAIELKNYEQANEHLQISEKYANNYPNLSYQHTVYQSLVKYYKAIGDFEKASHYGELVIAVNNKRNANIKKTSNELILKLQDKELNANKNKDYLIGLAVFLIVLTLIIVVFARRKYKMQSVQFKALINRVETAEALMQQQQTAKELKIENKSPHNGVMMTPETEERLLGELQVLEKKLFFLNKDTSLSSLASEMNSNTKYVSHLINTHKNKDFKNYINELRVFYVVRQFRNEPEYLKYKLSYIAEQAGFSSHSKFAAIFKNVTGFAPSVFIAQLEKEKTQLIP